VRLNLGVGSEGEMVIEYIQRGQSINAVNSGSVWRKDSMRVRGEGETGAGHFVGEKWLYTGCNTREGIIPDLPRIRHPQQYPFLTK